MGRGRSGAGAGGGSRKVTGGLNPANIKNERDLVSERGNKTKEVDDVLTVAKAMKDLYGLEVGQYTIADLEGADKYTTLAYSDGENVGFNSHYFDGVKMDSAYDSCVESGYHPSRGNKSGMEAVAAHEDGHILAAKVANAMGYHGPNAISYGSTKILMAAAKKLGTQMTHLGMGISGYAQTNASECVAEAVADVYCNGKKASKESRAIVSAMNDILKGK